MVDHARQTSWEEIVIAKKMQRRKQIQQIDSFHLLHIVHYLQKGRGGNKSWTILVQQRTTYISDINPYRFCNEVHIQQVSGPPVTGKLNEHNIRFPRDEEGNIGVKNGEYDMNNQPEKATFKYEQ